MLEEDGKRTDKEKKKLTSEELLLKIREIFMVDIKTKEQETNLGLTVSETELCLLTRRNPLLEPLLGVCACVLCLLVGFE